MPSIIWFDDFIVKGGDDMKQPKRDLVGKTFQSLTVLDEYYTKQKKHGTVVYWKCRCKCGAEMFVSRDSILSRNQPFCDQCRPFPVRKEKLYHIYHGILQRCYNPRNPRYMHYGGRGITMCDDWRLSYDNFKDWSIKNGYQPDMNLSIDRIDNDGNYCPSNCQWITISANSSKSDIGQQKSHTKLTDVYAISPSGERIDITNITKFCRDYNLVMPSVMASLHGRMPNTYCGWKFHSNQTR